MIIAGVNPLYDLPDGQQLSQILRRDSAPFVLRLGQHVDETTEVATCVCPESHWLESWGDAQPVAGIMSLCQPIIAQRGSTRSLLECLLAWTQSEATDSVTVPSAYAAIRDHWREHVFPRRMEKQLDAVAFWENAVRQGVIELPRPSEHPPAFDDRPVQLASLRVPTTDNSLILVLYPKISMLDGRPAHNPWLHELPDPVTKVTWDNYLSLSPSAAQRLGLRQGDLARVSISERSVQLPVLVQVGQHDRVVSVALGYGRQGTDRFAQIGPQWIEAGTSVGPNGLVGVNAAPLLRWAPTRCTTGAATSNWKPPGDIDGWPRPSRIKAYPFHRVWPRRERNTVRWWKRPPCPPSAKIRAGAVEEQEFEGELWSDDHSYSGYRWGLVIDLNKCTGCSACVIACQAENNVPVVGRDEVLRSREMHWIRIDWYFDDTADPVTTVHQPMLCHHCANAPCENVCPVLATVHSEEGLNEQVYNRCVGTRYCATTVPTKFAGSIGSNTATRDGWKTWPSTLISRFVRVGSWRNAVSVSNGFAKLHCWPASTAKKSLTASCKQLVSNRVRQPPSRLVT